MATNNNSISWMGNRVLDSASPRPAAPRAAVEPPLDIPLPMTVNAPPAAEEGYIPWYLAQNLGRSVRCEFIIGSNQYVDKAGILSEVGISYFVLDDIGSRTKIMCDLYSVKFVTILQE